MATYKRYTGVEYTFTGILTNPNVSYSKKMEAQVGYREKGSTKRLCECCNEIYVNDEGHMAVKHIFNVEFAGKDMEVVFYFNSPDSGIVIDVKLESGLKILGTPQECEVIFENLQKLTNDKLDFNRETGEVFIVKKFGANKDKDLDHGTKLIVEIIRTASRNTVTIISVERFRSGRAPEEVTYEGVDLNVFEGNAIEYHGLPAHKSNGIGLSATIAFDATDMGDDIKNEDGTMGRPIHIGLAHELIHAYYSINGIVDDSDSPDDLEDPDTGREDLSADEVLVREKENEIRAEHGVVLRAEPIDNTAKNIDEFLKNELDDE